MVFRCMSCNYYSQKNLTRDLNQEMQEAFRPEHLKQDVECVRVDFSCFTFERDLKSEKLLAINPITPHSWVFSVAVVLA